MRISDWSSDVCSSDLVHSQRAIDALKRALKFRLADRVWQHDGAAAPFTYSAILKAAPNLCAQRLVDRAMKQIFVEFRDALCGRFLGIDPHRHLIAGRLGAVRHQSRRTRCHVCPGFTSQIGLYRNSLSCDQLFAFENHRSEEHTSELQS